MALVNRWYVPCKFFLHKPKGDSPMPDAIQMLREDHRKVKQLFQDFEGSENSATQREIAQNAIRELELHATLEEEIFYPAAMEQLEEGDLINEAQEEHHVVRLLANELKRMRGNEERFKAKFTVMAESVKHHIEEEEGELFPQIENKLDGEEVGQRLEERRQKLQSKAARPASGDGSLKARSAKTKTRERSRKTKGKKAAGGRR
jgi:hemerythrin-like domain-containing protein